MWRSKYLTWYKGKNTHPFGENRSLLWQIIQHEYHDCNNNALATRLGPGKIRGYLMAQSALRLTCDVNGGRSPPFAALTDLSLSLPYPYVHRRFWNDRGCLRV